jgi:putative hydrolase of HD superfamily
MVNTELILKFFDAASIQRWNDKMRPMELTELDKQAHKMIIAYLLGKLEPDITNDIWVEIIEGGIFELLQRIVLTDLKPQLYYLIQKNKDKYKELNDWAFNELKPCIEPLGNRFSQKYRDYFVSRDNTLSKRILSAAHFYATKWEFDIIERTNPNGYEIRDIKDQIERGIESYYDVKGMKEIMHFYKRYRSFIDLCGELRFQIRWSNTPRLPKTSVLGHMYIVAILSYLYSVEINANPRRSINNYFSGLFHDLPEVLTRDVISPVKRAIPGLEDILKRYEVEEMEKNVYGLLDKKWHEDIKLFTEYEFNNVIDGKIVTLTSTEINKDFNGNNYNVRDGEIVGIVDMLSAFIECYLSIKIGIEPERLHKSHDQLLEKYRNTVIAGIDFGSVFNSFGLDAGGK